MNGVTAGDGAVVEFLFFGAKVRLDLWIRCDIRAKTGPASAASQIQVRFGLAFEDDASFEADTEAPSGPANEVSKAGSDHWRHLHAAEMKFPRAVNRIGRIAQVAYIAERE